MARQMAGNVYKPTEDGKIMMEVGTVFDTVYHYRSNLFDYSVQEGFAFNYEVNDKNRVTCICESRGCTWRIHASELPDGVSFKIKTLRGTHVCSRTEKNHLITADWIATKFHDMFRINPEVKVGMIEAKLYRRYALKVDKQKLYRAKRIALEAFSANHSDCYN